jgi:hypothetical protein
MKGDMECEVLKDTSDADAMKQARKRMARICMTASEAQLYCEAPNAARGNDRPGYPDMDYSD